MSVKLGIDAILLRGATVGVQGAIEVKNVKDLSLNISAGEADVTTRANSGWKATLATLKEGSLEFTMLVDSADADYTAISDAFFGNTAISLFVTDGNEKGLDADWTVTGFNISQSNEDAQTVAITIKPTASTRAPEWVD